MPLLLNNLQFVSQQFVSKVSSSMIHILNLNNLEINNQKTVKDYHFLDPKETWRKPRINSVKCSIVIVRFRITVCPALFLSLSMILKKNLKGKGLLSKWSSIIKLRVVSVVKVFDSFNNVSLIKIRLISVLKNLQTKLNTSKSIKNQ